MAGDIGIREQLEILPENASMAAAISAVTTAKSQGIHVHGSRIMVATALPETQVALIGTLETAGITGEAADMEMTNLDSGGYRDNQKISGFCARRDNQPGKDAIMGALILVLVLFVASPSWGATRDYYFKQSESSDSHECTESSPCQSIAKAGSLSLNPGDRILFNRGDTFTDTSKNGFDWTSRSGTSGSRITVTAYGSGPRPIITKNGKGYGFIIKSSDWIDISSLQINGYQFGIEIRGVRNSTFTDLKISNTGNACFHISMDKTNGNRTTRDISIDRVELDTCGKTGNGEGFYIGSNDTNDRSGNISITNSYIHDTFFECVEVKQGTDSSITITNSTLEHCHRSNHDVTTLPGGDSGVGLVATGARRNSNVTFRQNWIKDVVGNSKDTTGVGIRWNRQGITATYNVIANNEGEGIVLNDTAGAGGPRHLMTFNHNTIYGNGREATKKNSMTGSLVNSSSLTETDNIAWSNNIARPNAGGNDASNPQFVAAASNNFNLSPDSSALRTGAENTNKGALQTFSWTTASILADGMTVRVTGSVHSLFQPLSTGTASAFTLTCSTAGAQGGQRFTPSGPKDALITVATPIGQGETCTLAATAGAAQDSANIGGVLAPGGPLNSTSLVVTGLSVTNGSAVAPNLPNLLTVANIRQDCTNCETGRGCAKLLDLDLTAEESSAGNSGITSFTCEHDLGSIKTLDTFRAFCDALGTWRTQEIIVKTKVRRDDVYTTRVHADTCNANAWFSFSLEDVAARYVEITFACPSGCGGTQAREYELTATPQSLHFPGPAL